MHPYSLHVRIAAPASITAKLWLLWKEFFLERNIITIDCNDCRLIDWLADWNECNKLIIVLNDDEKRRDTYNFASQLLQLPNQNVQHEFRNFLIFGIEWQIKCKNRNKFTMIQIHSTRAVVGACPPTFSLDDIWLLHISWEIMTRAAAAESNCLFFFLQTYDYCFAVQQSLISQNNPIRSTIRLSCRCQFGL